MWIYIGKGRENLSETRHSHFFNHAYHVDLSGKEPGPTRLEGPLHVYLGTDLQMVKQSDPLEI
jgi:hypothetical protein